MATMMRLAVPETMKKEHDELHHELAAATKAGGRIGEAAMEVARVLHPHFVKEEEYALPPLGLLADLGQGHMPADVQKVLAMTDRLKAELPEMLQEHEIIVAALQKLVEVARSERQEGYATFAEKLILHARSEEEIAYPAALLIGEYVKLRLGGAGKPGAKS